MKTSLLCLLLLTQVSSNVDIHLRSGGEFNGHLVGVYTIGLRCQSASGGPVFIPYSELPADWQAQCQKGNHHSMTDLSTSMQDL